MGQESRSSLVGENKMSARAVIISRFNTEGICFQAQSCDYWKTSEKVSKLTHEDLSTGLLHDKVATFPQSE